MYEYADAAIRDMNRRNLRAFDKLKLIPLDEMNVVRTVTQTYDNSVSIAKKRYLAIAERAYKDGYKRATGKGIKGTPITEDWVLDMLEEDNELTLYRFLPEAERKSARLVEAMLASHNKNSEVDKALRLWTLQTSTYAIESVDKAALDSYQAAGIKRVRWITKEDGKECEVCKRRNGKVYAIGKVPPKPHYGCRCELWPVT